MDGQIISQRVDIGGVDMPGSLEALGMVLKRATTCRMSVMSVWAGVVVRSAVEGSARSGALMYSKMYVNCTIVSLFGKEYVQEQPLGTLRQALSSASQARHWQTA